MTTFGELAARGSLLVNDGYRTKASELGDSGFPVLRVAEVGDGTVIPSYGDHVRAEYRDKIGYKLSRVGDVLLTTKGTVGRRAIMPSLDAEFAYSPQLCFFRALDGSIIDRWLYYWLGGAAFWSQAVGVSQQTDMAPYISLRDLRAIEIEVPPLEEQLAIAGTLGALDDKIESNHRVRGLLRELGKAELAHALATAGRDPQALKSLTRSIARGIAPKYVDDDLSAPLVVNQKCIRGGWVALAPARRMVVREVPVAKKAYPGDVLVNSTGVGTLGRVGRWHEGEVFVDSHVSVVKADPDSVDPAVLAYALLGRESAIEGLSTGSTGQTELSPARLGELRVAVPDREHSRLLGSTLMGIENRAHQLAAENDRLAALRDALLPELLSGRMRVPSEAAA